jgi:hypothetical protein
MHKCLIIVAFLFCGCFQPKTQSSVFLDFSYTLENQESLLSQSRGANVFLVFVRISEVGSELFLDEVNKLEKLSADFDFLVLSIAPNEAPFLELYNETREYFFEVGMASEEVRTGQTSLGIIPVIPSAYLLDSEGQVVTYWNGVVENDLILKELKTKNFIP